jgi:replicative DNA helicase
MTDEDRSESEFAYLTGLLELFVDDTDRARKAIGLVPAAAFGDPIASGIFGMFSEALAAHDRPTLEDITSHEQYDACRQKVIDLLMKAKAQRCAYSLGVERRARDVRAEWKRRLLADLAGDLSVVVDDRSASPAEILAATKAINDAAENIENGERLETLTDAIDEWSRMDATPVIPTGFRPVDALCGGGLPIGGMFVVAAQPSVGKSALALQLVLGALANDPGLNAVWCMGEMTKEAFARRAICHWSTRGGMHLVSMSSAEHRSDLAKGAALNMVGVAEVAGRLMLVKPPLTIQKIEQAVIEKKARLVVVDYVQLVELDGAQDRRSEIDGIVKRLRRLSLEHGAATVCVSNIAKAVAADTRIGAIGKESSELDFAADVLLLGVADAAEDRQALRQVRWACKKNRHGPCEDLVTTFDGSLQTFTDSMASRETAFDDWGRVV